MQAGSLRSKMNNEINRRLFLKSLNRLRRQTFGDETLTLFETTPETGETEIAEFAEDWSGKRKVSVTDSGAESEYWQIQIAAADDWETSQAYMNRAVSLKIGDRRFAVKKLEKPIGNARVWKMRAEVQ